MYGLLWVLRHSSCIVWSKLAQRYGYVKILLISMLLQAIGIVLPALATNSMTLYASAFILGQPLWELQLFVQH